LGTWKDLAVPGGDAGHRKGELGAFQGFGACVNKIQALRSFKRNFVPHALDDKAAQAESGSPGWDV